MKKLTLEYIAGFVDGEGSFMIRKRGKGGYFPSFSISNTDRQILKDIRKYFSLSTKLKPYWPKKPNHKISYEMSASSIDDCRSIATLLEPHLRVKKEQAQIIMQYPRADPTLRGRGSFGDLSTRALVQKLRDRIILLNKTGPPGQEVI